MSRALSDRVDRVFHRLSRARAAERAAWEPEGYPSRGWSWDAATRVSTRCDRLSRLLGALHVRVEADPIPLCPACVGSIGGAHGGPDAPWRPARPGEPCGAADCGGAS